MLNAQEYGDLLWQAQRNDGKSPVSDVYGSGETAVIPEFLDADHRLPSGDVDWVDEIMQKPWSSPITSLWRKQIKLAATCSP